MIFFVNKDVLVLSFGKLFQVILSLISIRVLTTVLNEQQVGNYYLLTTFLILFNFAFLNPLGQFYGRNLIRWHKSNNLLNATATLTVFRFLAILFSTFIATGIYYYMDYQKYYSLAAFLIFIFLSLSASIHGVLLNAVNTLGDRYKFTIYNVSTLALSLVLSLTLINYFQKSAINWLYGSTIIQLIFSIFIFKSITKNNLFSFTKIKSLFKASYFKSVFFFIVPVTITLFLQWGQNTSYRLIIESRYSIEMLAHLGVGISIATSIFAIIESLAQQYLNPIFLEKITGATKKERATVWNELSNNIIPLYIMTTIFVISTSPYLIRILVAEKFHEAYIYTTIGALVEFFRVMTNLVYMVSQSELKTNTTVSPYLIGFIFSIGTLYFVDLSSGLWMVPVTLTGGYFVIFIMLFINMKKLLDIKICLKRIQKAALLSSPLLYIYSLNANKSLSFTISILTISLLYLLGVIYYNYRDLKLKP